MTHTNKEVRIGTIQRKIAWLLRKETHTNSEMRLMGAETLSMARSFQNFV